MAVWTDFDVWADSLEAERFPVRCPYVDPGPVTITEYDDDVPEPCEVCGRVFGSKTLQAHRKGKHGLRAEFCIHGHELTEDNRGKDGLCRTCARARRRKWSKAHPDRVKAENKRQHGLRLARGLDK